jgi:hypothetical protein
MHITGDLRQNFAAALRAARQHGLTVARLQDRL